MRLIRDRAATVAVSGTNGPAAAWFGLPQVVASLWACVLACNALVLAVTVFSLHAAWTSEFDDARSQTQNLALALEREIDGIFDSVDFSLRVLAEHYAKGGGTPRDFAARIDEHRAQLPILSGLRGSDAGGRMIFGLAPGEPANVDVLDREYFVRHRDEPGAGLLISKPVFAKIKRQWSLVLSRRLNDADGRFAGVVSAAIPLRHFAERFAALKLGEQGSIGFRDGALRLIVRHPELPDGPQFGSTRIADDFKQALAANPAVGSYRAGATSIDGIRRIHSYRRNARFDFYINVGIAEREHLAGWQRNAVVAASLAALVLISTTLLGFWFQRSVRAGRQTMARLTQSEADFRALAETAPYGIVLLAANGHFLYVNPTFTRMLGYTLEDLPDVERWFSQAYPDPDYRAHVLNVWRQEVVAKTASEVIQRGFVVVGKHGQRREIDFHVTRLHEGRIVVSFDDVTERRKAERDIEALAFYDALTSLPNRRLMLDRLNLALAASARDGSHLAMLFLDLDQFKQLNDTQGHDVGDRLLVETAQRIRQCVRETDTVSRLGGDEFIVVLDRLSGDLREAADQVAVVADKIIARVAEPFELAGRPHHGSISIGIALARGQEISADELLRRADMAMYQAKSAGRNTRCFFDTEMQARTLARIALERELREGIAASQFMLVYQPQISACGACVGFEALVRWDSPTRGRVSPLDFIPIAEESGLILTLGRWILEAATAELGRLQHEFPERGLSMAINVSPRQFRQPEFVEVVRAAMTAAAIGRGGLKIEITESVLLDELERVVDTLKTLRELGVEVALDDFGTGYSSLSYLKQLPIDQLKIDRSFVRDIADDPNDAAICRAIVAMGRTLGLTVIAEGVESPDQWRMLADEGCHVGQGYWFARPMPAAELDPWLRQQHSEPAAKEAAKP